MIDPKWKHKDIWKTDGDTFLIEVVRWSSPSTAKTTQRF
jgi:hypothetical protein